METAHGPAAVAVDPPIVRHSLFQGVLLALAALREHDAEADEEQLYARLEFRASPGLGFPGRELEALEFFEHEGHRHARLWLNPLGLHGVGSPLPAFYVEQALGDGPQGNPTRDFLDLFNDRLQRLLLPTWRKYRYYARFRSDGHDSLSMQLLSLAGLGGQNLRAASALDFRRLLPYLGLLGVRVHSAALIEAVLRYYFRHPPLHIEQCRERWMRIPEDQLGRLGGEQARLGESLALGRRVRDRSGRFRLCLRQLDWSRFHDFLRIGKDAEVLRELLQLLLRDPLDYDIRLELRADQLRPLHLGRDNPCRLGWTSWLTPERADGVVLLGPGEKD